MVIELDINGARVIITGDNLSVSVSQDSQKPTAILSPIKSRLRCPTGAEIIALRKSLGLRQKPFSILIGVSQASVSRWENGVEQPNGSAAVLLASMIEEAA